MVEKQDQREAEIAALGNWCLAVVRGRSELGADPSAQEMERIVLLAIEQKRVADLKSIRRHFAEWIRGLSPAQQAVVRAHTSGWEDDANQEDEEAVLRRVVKRGKISTVDEYETLRAWFEFTQEDAARAQDLAVVDALLTGSGTKVR